MDKKEISKIKNTKISSEWKNFSNTEAYKDFMTYLNIQDQFAIGEAKGDINTNSSENPQDLIFDPQKAAYLLQRSVGYDIVRTYIEGYVNL